MSFSRSLNTICSLLLIFSFQARADSSSGSSVFENPRRDLSIIGVTTVGGAVVGLSTLSFVDKPSDNLKNILVGGAIGIIAGVGIVAYMQATKSKTAYESVVYGPKASPFESQRTDWGLPERSSLQAKGPALSGNFTF